VGLLVGTQPQPLGFIVTNHWYQRSNRTSPQTNQQNHQYRAPSGPNATLPQQPIEATASRLPLQPSPKPHCHTAAQYGPFCGFSGAYPAQWLLARWCRPGGTNAASLLRGCTRDHSPKAAQPQGRVAAIAPRPIGYTGPKIYQAHLASGSTCPQPHISLSGS
jgi:hypothetical protein